MLRRIYTIIEPLKSLSIHGSQTPCTLILEARALSTSSVLLTDLKKPSTSVADIPQQKPLNKAMRAYLQRAREHDEFMRAQRHEYEIGKRHLANMMGENPETFTQEDVDNAIEYLFPSGLFEKKARPSMKPPEEIFPQRKAAEFDETGRPYHFLFYTGRPHFYQLLHDTVQHINDLYKFEDSMIRKGLKPDPNNELQLSGYQWLDKQLLEKKLVETITDRDYDGFLSVMERLSKLPYSYRVKDFIMEYRKPLMNQTRAYEAIKPQVGEDGRQFVTVYECRRKSARATVTIKMPGTGKININGEDIHYFKDVQSKEQLLFPLIFSNMQNKVDIEAEVKNGGSSGQAGAIRWGISWGLRSFVDKETMEKMRLAGLLTRDFRTRERKKPGQYGARRKFTWKKR